MSTALAKLVKVIQTGLLTYACVISIGSAVSAPQTLDHYKLWLSVKEACPFFFTTCILPKLLFCRWIENRSTAVVFEVKLRTCSFVARFEPWYANPSVLSMTLHYFFVFFLVWITKPVITRYHFCLVSPAYLKEIVKLALHTIILLGGWTIFHFSVTNVQLCCVRKCQYISTFV